MHNFFSKYKDIHKGDVAYIFGSGPSLNDFQEQEPGIYIAGNNAHKFENVRNKLNYLFFLYRGYDLYYNNTSTVYGDYCKLIRELPDTIKRFCCLNFHTRMDEPTVNKIKEEVKDVDFYFVTDEPPARKLDITIEKLWNFSIVFSMVLFTLYTGVKKIYLVGCDCTSGYFFKEKYSGEQFHNYESYKKQWNMMKQYISIFHSDVEIVSINPVGLTGLFKDIYTKVTHNIVSRNLFSSSLNVIPIAYTNGIRYLLKNDNDLISNVTLQKRGWGIKYNNFCSSFIDNNTSVIDIGANMGSFCIDIAIRNPTCTIMAFEAQKMKSFQLCGNIFLNSLENIEVYQYALTNTDDKTLPFVIANDGNNGASRLEIEAVKTNFQGKTKVMVPSMKLNDIPDNKRRISMIKIDVEGHERSVIEGGLSLISTHRPYIVFESWDFEYNRQEQQRLFDLLKSINYDIFKIEPHEYFACHNENNTVEFREKMTEQLNILSN